MRELLRLRHAQVAQMMLGENVREDVVHRLRKNDQRQLVELVVLRHAHIVQTLPDLRTWNGFIERFPAFQVPPAVLVQSAFDETIPRAEIPKGLHYVCMTQNVKLYELPLIILPQSMDNIL